MKSVKRIILVLTAAVLSVTMVKAQDEENALEISGSVDTYYKYDFAGVSNSPTSFASDQNSVSIGMIDLGLTQTWGNATFVGELSFGPRGNQSLPVGGINIQNLYASYALTDKLTATAGYMGTFVGYEVISPAANFNYSTSYLFSWGPFQNAGFKLDYSFSDRFAVMVGLFNDWNAYTDPDPSVEDIGAQVYVSPVDGWDAYINFCMGPQSGTIIDLTTGYQITDAFYLGLNAADYTAKDETGYTGFALYPQYAFSDKLALGYRGEYFIMKSGSDADNSNVFSNTITLNFYHGPFTFSSEFRTDAASEEGMFMDSDGAGTKSFSQILFAAIYAF